MFTRKNSYASINVKPEGGGGGTPGVCGAFDFSEQYLVKVATVGPQNLVKSGQISPPVAFCSTDAPKNIAQLIYLRIT